jgi:hypothetical protein
MEIGIVFKLLFFMIWPFLLLFLCYLFDREGFKRRLERVKRELFK